MAVHGLLYSRIGYDCKDPKRALVRSTDRAYLRDNAWFEIAPAAGGEALYAGRAAYWGEKWKSHWWEIDFSALDTEGEYRIRIPHSAIEVSDPIKIGRSVLWDETVTLVALEQMEAREALARNRRGWKDCGSVWREANSHAATVIGLCDLLALGFQWLEDRDVSRLARQLTVGCDYLAQCQDKAEQCGFPSGAVVHEIPNHMFVIPGDVAQSAVAFGYASRLLTDRDPGRSADYLKRAILAVDYLLRDAKPYGPAGFSHWNHGAPEDFDVPEQFMTRDLLMMLWGAVELWASGQTRYQQDAVRLARRIIRRQVHEEHSEGGYYGHFYTFDGGGFTEKANIHHHVGHDTGGSFPYYITPLIDMLSRWYDHPDAPLWREAVRKFAYGFLKPACMENPFRLIPAGYYANEGILNFCGPWHGINTSIAFGSALASRLEAMFGDRAFREIATGNLQWIAGLHAGITKESLAGSLFWKADIPEGVALPYSQIQGAGHRQTGNWSGIVGSIPNGFSVNPQFELKVKPSAEADAPLLYTDEDWIPHGAGWVSALAWRRDCKLYADL